MSQINIKDVAKEAGVSTATVSRVINGSPSVRRATIQKVNEAIARTNYVPNASARSLKTNATKTVGLLVSDISNPHFILMSVSIESILNKSGYSVIICNTNDNPEMELTYLQRLVAMNIDGLIINTTGRIDDYICMLSQTTPVVLVDRSIQSPTFKGDFVGSNNFDGARSMVSHLLGYGHRRIGFIVSSQKVSTSEERNAGFATEMKNAGIPIDKDYPYLYSVNSLFEQGGYDGCRYLMGLETPPTAIAIANNVMAIGAYKYCTEKGINIPDQISIVSYGTIEHAALFKTYPTYVTLSASYMGEKAAAAVLSRIANPKINNRESIFEPVLDIHESTRKIL